MELSLLETFRAGPSYTVDLLERFRRDYPDLEPFLLIGSDSLGELHTWKDPEKILAMATPVVFLRPGYPPVIQIPGPVALIVLDEPMPAVASREIRERIRRGEDVSESVPPEVLRFALEEGLYS